MSTVQGMAIRYADHPTSAMPSEDGGSTGGSYSNRSSPSSRRTSGTGGTTAARVLSVPSCTHAKWERSTKFSTRRSAEVGHTYGAPATTRNSRSPQDGLAGIFVGHPGSSRTQTSPYASAASKASTRARLGMATPGMAGISTHLPSPSQRQPWYAHCTVEPHTQPTDKRVERWRHRSRSATTRPSSAATTSRSPSSSTPSSAPSPRGAAANSAAVHTGCQNRRSAAGSGETLSGLPSCSRTSISWRSCSARWRIEIPSVRST